MRSYLVCGPESSGNRYLHRLLLQGGCSCEAGCQPASQIYPFDLAVPATMPERLALIRSLPHGGRWTDLPALCQQLESVSTDGVTVLCPKRDREMVAASLVCRGFVRTLAEGRALWSIFWDYLHPNLAKAHGQDRVVVVPYASLGDPAYRDRLHRTLELPGEFQEPFVDGDVKYQ